MDEQSQQIKFLVVVAAVICAVIIGYNAFYVPDAPLTEPAVTADVSSASEEYTPSSVTSKAVQTASATLSEHVLSKASNKPMGKVNINTATAQQLSDGLKGIGQGLAGRIVEYRKQHGAFHTVDQLKNVAGIGDKKFAEIRDSITID